MASDLHAAIDALYRAESRRIFATLVRLLGDFDRAEEALHEAFRAAVETWPRDGLPENPRAWLISAGRFKAIDAIRRGARFEPLPDELDPVDPASLSDADRDPIEDDRLRLIFTCCHPALAPDAQIALTLREVCGLTTEAIAHAFLTGAPTLAQRIVRAKTKIRDARIPYQVPGDDEWPARLPPVLRVVYLVFNEGYSPAAGPDLTRQDLSAEAIRLGRLLLELLPPAAAGAEVPGLLALMLLHESRRAARSDADGDLVLLEAQDRSRWDALLIAEGRGLVQRALRAGRAGPYTLQAAIAALHADAPTTEATDWAQIVRLYELLLAEEPSPVIALNHAAALAMRDGPAVGLARIDALLAAGDLGRYHLAQAARAELCRRLGRFDEARAAYDAALALAQQAPERRFLQRQRDALPPA
jgi:RNA polymerase sigma-70 factor, ECF subfamily